MEDSARYAGQRAGLGLSIGKLHKVFSNFLGIFVQLAQITQVNRQNAQKFISIFAVFYATCTKPL